MFTSPKEDPCEVLHPISITISLATSFYWYVNKAQIVTVDAFKVNPDLKSWDHPPVILFNYNYMYKYIGKNTSSYKLGHHSTLTHL